MIIKRLFNSEAEHREFLEEVSKACLRQVATSEEAELMSDFFDLWDSDSYRELTDSEKKGAEIFKKIEDSWLGELSNIIKAAGMELPELAPWAFAEGPVTECWDSVNGEDYNEDGSIIPEWIPQNAKLKAIQYPCVFVGWIEETGDRVAKSGILFSDYVELRDFS